MKPTFCLNRNTTICWCLLWSQTRIFGPRFYPND